MGFLKKLLGKKEIEGIDFSAVKTNEMAKELCEKKELAMLYIVPLRFGGEEESNNILYVPPEIVDLKQRYDSVAEKLLLESGTRYICTPEYKGKSFVPSALHIAVTRKNRFTQSIKIM